MEAGSKRGNPVTHGNTHLDKSEDDWLQLFKNVHSKYEACILWHFSNLYRNYLKQCKTTMTLLSQIRFKTKQHQLHNVLTKNGSTNFACDNVLWNKFRKQT